MRAMLILLAVLTLGCDRLGVTAAGCNRPTTLPPCIYRVYLTDDHCHVDSFDVVVLRDDVGKLAQEIAPRLSDVWPLKAVVSGLE